MARRKRAKRKTKLFSLSGGGKKRFTAVLKNTLKVFAVVIVFGAIAAGFVFLGSYVNSDTKKTGLLELTDPPAWVNEELKNKIYRAATAGGEDLKLDEDGAMTIQQNIESMISWLDEIKVHTTHDRFRIQARWRRPLAMVKSAAGKLFYVDKELVVLEYVPISSLTVVEVTGLGRLSRRLVPGQTLLKEDLSAAVAVLNQLDRMDRIITPDKPLLCEIESIDVSNFDGRKNKKQPHIVLYTTDETKILWGAEIGTWQRHLEATDEEKLAKLYEYYKTNGSLLGSVKYINLRNPQNRIPQPVDKY